MPTRGPQFQGPLFHGTSRHLQDAVVPATVHGSGSHWGNMGAEEGQPSREHAFATTQENTAWYFAQHAAASELSTTNRVRARVYEVASHPKMRPGVHEELHEYVAPRFPLTGVVHDIKPGQQGTFPQVNWNRQASRRAMGVDANHPLTNPLHLLSHEDQVAASNADATGQQDDAHMAFKSRIESLGQTALFNTRDMAPQMPLDYKRAQTHDLRHVVNEGAAPAHAVDPAMVEAESHDSWNRSKGRRTGAAERLRKDREWRGR